MPPPPRTQRSAASEVLGNPDLAGQIVRPATANNARAALSRVDTTWHQVVAEQRESGWEEALDRYIQGMQSLNNPPTLRRDVLALRWQKLGERQAFTLFAFQVHPQRRICQRSTGLCPHGAIDGALNPKQTPSFPRTECTNGAP
jgi:hypothetical protein